MSGSKEFPASDYERNSGLEKLNRNNTNESIDYKSSLQNQFSHFLNDGAAGQNSIAEKMTSRNIKRDRLIEKMKDVLIKEFAEADENNDNKITLEELQTYIQKQSKGRRMTDRQIKTLFHEMDTNKSGAITIDEF